LMTQFLTKLTPPGLTRKQIDKLKKQAGIRIFIGAVSIALGFCAPFYIDDINLWCSLFEAFGMVMLLSGGLIQPYMEYKKENTFIGVTENKQLQMSSLRYGLRKTYDVPIADVKTVEIVNLPKKPVTWYFKGSQIKQTISFDASLFPRKKHRTLLAEITKHGTNIRVIHKKEKPGSPGSTKRPQDDYEFLIGNED
ncbi:MAG: hypothetical protein GY757_34175, partial [bacterium]|nr:hypothetical protein [bacterium]